MKKGKEPEYPLVSSQIEKYLTDTLTSSKALSAHEKKHGDTHCEIVNEDEIYLLLRNPNYEPSNPKSVPHIRDRRICGALRNTPWKDGTQEGDRLRCLLPAGHNTNNPGYGKCHQHRFMGHGGTTQNLRFLQGMKKKGFALEIAELDHIVGGVLNDPALGEIDYEIAVLQHLLAVETNKETEFISSKAILACTEAVMKGKAIKAKMEQERLLMDVNSIRMYVRAIFEVLRQNLPAALYSKIAHLIEDAINFPINKAMADIVARQAEEAEYSLDPDQEVSNDED